MRSPWMAAALLLLVGCSGQPTPSTSLALCSDPRPQVCTMEYAPVCAALTKGGTKEYASACNACASDEVTGWEQGPCPE